MLVFVFRAFLERRTPRVVPWAHLCLSIRFRAPIRNLCSRFRATWSRALSFPHTRKVPRFPLQSPRTPCHVRRSNLIALPTRYNLPCHVRSVLVQHGEQTHVCTSSGTAASDDVVMKVLRYVGLPTSSLHRVPPRYRRFIGNFSSKLPRESRGGVLLVPQVWRDVMR